MIDPKPREEHVADADQILAAAGPDLQLWLADQGLSIDQAAAVHWGSLTSSLKSAGKRDVAEDWLAEQKSALVKTWKVTTRTRTAGEICRRFLSAKMESVEGVSNRRPMLNDMAELDILPEYLKWGINHPDAIPLVKPTPEEQAVRAAESKRYERKHRCPNQAAANYLLHIQGSEKALQKAFDDAKAYNIEHRKKSKKELVSETDQREGQRILDMKAERQKLAERFGKGA
jgi:hypothetical protein